MTVFFKSKRKPLLKISFVCHVITHYHLQQRGDLLSKLFKSQWPVISIYGNWVNLGEEQRGKAISKLTKCIFYSVNFFLPLPSSRVITYPAKYLQLTSLLWYFLDVINVANPEIWFEGAFSMLKHQCRTLY